MNEQKKFGLIGKDISYSFSNKYFTDKFNKLQLKHHSYSIFDLEDIHKVNDLFDDPLLTGLNVTIPYKEQIIPFLDELSDEAKEIGAVNTVLIRNNKKIGYNTDVAGFESTLLLHLKDYHESAIILGNGGAAKAIKYILKKHHIPFVVVARNLDLNFTNLSAEMVAQHQIIIQSTPVGTFPNEEDCLDFPFEALTNKHLIIDLIYNPNYTQFIKNAAKFEAKTVNGYYMLEQQAEKSWEIWNSL